MFLAYVHVRMRRGSTICREFNFSRTMALRSALWVWRRKGSPHTAPVSLTLLFTLLNWMTVVGKKLFFLELYISFFLYFRPWFKKHYTYHYYFPQKPKMLTFQIFPGQNPQKVWCDDPPKIRPISRTWRYFSTVIYFVFTTLDVIHVIYI